MHFHSFLPALALSVPFVSARAAAGHKRTTHCSGGHGVPTNQNTVVTAPAADGQNTAQTSSPYGTNTTTFGNATEVDVLIVGGGATGAWTAVQLRDQGKTVAVVERASRLGGHVDTLYAAGSGAPIDYGVQAYIDNNQTRQFFARFGLELSAAAQSSLPSVVADFGLGVVVPNATAPDLASLQGPLTSYVLAALQFGFLGEGAYDLPAEVPADLLLPFGEFVAKNNLTAALPVVWQFAQGVGNLLDATTLYVLQNFGVPHILGLQQGYLYAPEGNQAVYDRAAAFLADSVRYDSRVQRTTRNADGTTTVVVAGSGSSSSSTTTIRASKVLVTIPPTLDNLAGFDLSADERALFAQWQDVPYYVGVTAGTGLPDLTNFINANLTSPVGLPTTPLVWRLESVGVPGYQTVKVIGERDSAAAQALVTAAVGRLGRALNATTTSTTTTFAAWEQHDNLQLHVSPEAVRDGFYQKLYALQGVNGTYWTGHAFCSDYSPLLWQFTEKRVLPGLLA